MNNKTLIVITGPTASGKSALAVELALKLNTDIISADSRQIYKEIPIVTAAPSEEEKKGVIHHLIQILDLGDYYSASLFEQQAAEIIDNLFKSNDYAIVCGGSMLYLDALCNGIDELPTVPEEKRNSLMAEWEKKGNDWLLEELKKVDPTSFDRIDHRNLKRIFHALEITLTAGKPYSELLKGKRINREYNIIKFALGGEREKLFERINGRVLKMMDQGLESEARKVYHLRHLNSLNTVGLKEMFKYFEGGFTKEEAISRIQKNTRVYAKKQLTWHKKDTSLRWLDFTKPMEENLDIIIKDL